MVTRRPNCLTSRSITIIGIRNYLLATLSFLLFAFISSPAHAIEKPENLSTKPKRPARINATSPQTIILTQEEKTWLKQNPHLKLAAFMDQPPFVMKAPDGKPIGILPEILTYLSRSLGQEISLEMFDTARLSHAHALDAGIYGHSAIVKTIPYPNKYLVTDSYLKTPVYLITLQKNRALIKDPTDLQGKKVAIPRGHNGVANYLDKIGNVEKVLVDTPLEQMQKVLAGDADALLGYANYPYLMNKYLMTELVVTDVLQTGMGLHIGVNPKYPILHRILNRVIGTLDEQAGQDILAKWTTISRGDLLQIALTKKEQVWLADHRVIKIGIGESWPPFVYRKSDGSLEGFDVDILARINDLTGAEIRLIAGPWKEIVEQAKRRQIDGLAESAATESRREHFSFTEPYNVVEYGAATLPEKAAEISSASDLRGKRIAHLKGNVWTEKIIKSLGNVRIIEAESEEAGFRLVMEGKADASIIPTHQYVRLREIFHDSLVIAHVFAEEKYILRPVYSIRKDWPELVSIINKSLFALGEKEKQAIFEKWVPLGKSAFTQTIGLIDSESAPFNEQAGFSQTEFLLQSLVIVFLCLSLVLVVIWVIRGRPKQLTIRGTLVFGSFIFTGLIIAIGVFNAMLLEREHSQHELMKRHLQSLNLAYELKQSSDDLTRFARTFAITGNPKYEKYFHEITAIRDGKQAHPKEFTPSYWDRVSAGHVEPDQDGELYSIEQRMIELGFTEKEQALLAAAKRESDDLINLEKVAMNAVKGLYKDVDGRFAITREPDLEMARNLLHGREYHAAKGRIMEQIDKFFAVLEGRIRHDETRNMQRNHAILLGIIILTVITIGFSVYTFFLFRRRIISPLTMVESAAHTIEDGDYSFHIDLKSRDEIGSLANAFNLMARSIRKHTEDLQTSEARLNFLISANPGVIYTCSATPPFGATFIAPNITEQMGFRPEQFTQNSEFWAKNIHPEDRKRIFHDLVDLFEHDKHQLEYRFRMSDGSYRWMLDKLRLIRNESGEPIEIVGYRIDINDRKEMEDELRKLSRATEASPASIVITDPDGTIEYVNPKFTEVTGYSAEEAIGQNPRMLSSGKQSPEFYRELWNTITTGNEWHGEFENKRKDGRHYWEQASISPILNDRGKISHYVAIKEDVTEKRRAEATFKEVVKGTSGATGKGFFQHLVRHLATGLGVRYAMVAELMPGNANRVRTLAVWADGKLLQNYEYDLAGTPCDNAVKKNLCFYPSGVKELYPNDHLLVDMDVESYIGGPLLNSIGQTLGILAVLDSRPMTKSPLMTSLLEIFSLRAAEELTRERTERELHEAREVAETATRSKSEFLANMSHEIRTPLNAVFGFLELVLEDRSLSELQRKYLATAQLSAKSLLDLINDILDISKLESGKLSIEQRPFNLHRLLERIHETMAIQAGGKGLDLQLDIQPAVPRTVVGDPLRLRQIIINLVGNALKFTEKGKVGICVWPVEEGDQIHFMIEDTGIGIPADQLQHIFESFTQADSSTTRKYGGTGLGTTISRELVELMGGRIWVESEPDKGSTFHFTVNLPATDQDAEEADMFVVPGNAAASGSRRGLRILLAEDVEVNVTLARIRLEQQGHEVTVARNGLEAIKAFMTGGIDLILMDIQMPEMGGIEAAERIRTLEIDSGGHVPIIALTASVTKEETERYFEAGMDAVVAKPIDFNELFKTMGSLLPDEEIQGGIDPPELEFPSLDGVDLKKGLQVWQDPETYRKQLLVFPDNYGQTAEKLSRYLENGDVSEAFRLAHTLKGVAGSLSLTKVFSLAETINTLLRKEQRDAVRDLLAPLADALKEAAASIGKLEYHPPKEEAPPRQELDLPKLAIVFGNMLKAFDQFNPDAIEPFLKKLALYLSSDQLDPIMKALEMFNFDGAKRETIYLAETLGIKLEV